MCWKHSKNWKISTAFLTWPVGSVLITCFLVNSLGNYSGDEGGNTRPTEGNLTITEELTPFPPTIENQDPTPTTNFTNSSSGWTRLNLKAWTKPLTFSSLFYKTLVLIQEWCGCKIKVTIITREVCMTRLCANLANCIHNFCRKHTFTPLCTVIVSHTNGIWILIFKPTQLTFSHFTLTGLI